MKLLKSILFGMLFPFMIPVIVNIMMSLQGYHSNPFNDIVFKNWQIWLMIYIVTAIILSWCFYAAETRKEAKQQAEEEERMRREELEEQMRQYLEKKLKEDIDKENKD